MLGDVGCVPRHRSDFLNQYAPFPASVRKPEVAPSAHRVMTPVRRALRSVGAVLAGVPPSPRTGRRARWKGQDPAGATPRVKGVRGCVQQTRRRLTEPEPSRSPRPASAVDSRRRPSVRRVRLGAGPGTTGEVGGRGASRMIDHAELRGCAFAKLGPTDGWSNAFETTTGVPMVTKADVTGQTKPSIPTATCACTTSPTTNLICPGFRQRCQPSTTGTATAGHGSCKAGWPPTPTHSRPWTSRKAKHASRSPTG